MIHIFILIIESISFFWNKFLWSVCFVTHFFRLTNFWILLSILIYFINTFFIFKIQFSDKLFRWRQISWKEIFISNRFNSIIKPRKNIYWDKFIYFYVLILWNFFTNFLRSLFDILRIKQRNWVFDTNSQFLISISLQPNVVHLRYFKP